MQTRKIWGEDNDDDYYDENDADDDHHNDNDDQNLFGLILSLYAKDIFWSLHAHLLNSMVDTIVMMMIDTYISKKYYWSEDKT